jgi:SPP1 family phage portal protein
MTYMAEDEVRFKALDTKGCIPIFDGTIENNLIAFIRYYTDYDIVEDKEYTIVEVINSTEVIRYKTNDSISSFELLETYQHYFNMVPIAIYKNNEEQTGDFENIISLIDAYDKLESDSLNDFEYFVDAYLALYGFTADSEDVRQMKENRVLLMDEGTKAEWLIKQTSDVNIENIKNRIDADIHKFAKCPNMADKEFASNASGVAIKYKLLGTENKIAIKERKFKRGLQQRIELLANIKGVLASGFDWRSIDIIFTRNIPANDADIANMVNTLSDIVSKETLLAQIPFVEDVQAELEKVKAERDENPFYQTAIGYQTRAMEAEEEEEPVENEL